MILLAKWECRLRIAIKGLQTQIIESKYVIGATWMKGVIGKNLVMTNNGGIQWWPIEMTHWAEEIVVWMGENPSTNFDGGNSGKKSTKKKEKKDKWEWKQMIMVHILSKNC